VVGHCVRLPVTVLLVADDDRVREGLRRPLERSGAVHVIATATLEDDVAGLVRQHAPDIVLLDMLGQDCRALALCREVARDVPVLVLSAYLTPAEWHKARAAGAAGFHLKTIGIDELVRKVEAVSAARPRLG
jgi:DNA-binding NarL/FixJ family response regulator